MYIQEIVVDGFKSYAHRTTIEGFDPHFNAITGLNGSGKSNILDSICFVLGITNLSHVRAGNLSELVYKQGQAGVTKATVTIIFNNQDAAQSPVGYEQCQEVTVSRQVLLGGKSKYWINGRVAPAGQVQNLFHSVQLNVNNPHFLIMQGRITKVLNMKPHEILGMLEEATGTRMYETKRVAALKTIDKKQQKVDELNNILAEEITPTLERLRSEKQSYLQWSKNNADLERLERLVVAYEFHRASKALDRNEEGFSGMNEELKGMEARSSDIQEEIDVIDAEIEERSLSLKGEHQEAFNKAKQMEDKRSKELVKVTSTWQNAKSELEKAETELIATRKLLTETRQGAESKQNEIDNAIDDTEETQQAAHSAEELLAQLTQQYQNISAGISSEEGDEGRTLPEQISKAHNDSKKAESRAQQAKMKIDHITKQLDSVKKDLHKQGKKVDDMDAERKVLIDKVDNLKSQIEHLDFSQETYDALEAEKLDIEPTISDMRTRLESLTAQLNERLSFDYTDPVRGFDRSKVKGLVAKLISVKDAKYATALEVAAGGRLYQVVVDEAITGKALLDRGQLERRVTIIPLDKIKSRQVSNNARSQAKQTADRMNTEAFSAIELVGFSEEVRNAVEYVFGAAIVVDGMKAANEICDLTKTRTVTLDGDVFDPTGTISGGSKNQLGATLAQLSEVAEIEQELAAKELRLRDVSKQITSLQVVSKKYDALSRNLTLAQAELEAKVKQMSYSSVGMLIEKRDTFQHELKEAEDELEAMSKEQETKWALYTQLTEHEVELTQKREEKISDIATAVKQAKADVQMKSQAAREVSSSIETLKLELQSLQGEVEAAEEAVRLAESVVEEYSTAETNLQIQVGEIKSLYDETKTELAVLEEKMSAYSSQLSALKSKKTELKKTSDEYAIKAKKLSMAINNALKERSSAEKMVANLLRKHSWIESERRAFGVSGGDYDFEAMDSNNFAKKLDTVRKEQETLAKSINKKVIGMIEKAEGEYTELQRKRKVVENDKKKIQDFIQELDVKKKTELEHTWVKVNKDFGSIFSTLLPGAFAKLEPPEGLEAWEGLEVKVAFGNVWKESLSELSGGQRSLLALSLILSLLLFKPAPMYILDEVDAALDLSHTQNIGHMLKTHFSQSQFLVVSLKENMFNNANVIFRTKFVDGVSTVSRTIGSGMNSGSSASKVLTNNNSTMGFTSKGSGKASQSRGRESQKGKENL